MTLKRALPHFPVRLAAVVVACAAGAAGAQAQLVLPGATGPTPSGTTQAPAAVARPAPAPAQAVSVRATGEDSLIGKTFYLNGTRGKIVVERRDKSGMRLQFIASGYKISRPSEACGVEFGGGQFLDAAPAGRPDGVPRLKLAFEACPVTLDVLEGAVLVGGVTAACKFQEADCAVDPRGMWGPPASVVEAQAKAIETDRSIADKTVRQNFKALLSRTKEKQEIKAVAAEQAGFTSERELTCRDYSRETVHGFCASRYTEWRAASLAARVNRIDGKPEDTAVAELKAKPKPRPKPSETASVSGVPEPGGPAAPVQRAPAREPNFFERLFR